MELSPNLQSALNQSLARWSTKSLAGAVPKLSDRYRAGESGRSGSFTESPLDVAAYVAYRLPATYAAMVTVLREVSQRLPEFSPKNLLDVGAGPGTAMWATTQIWPQIEDITLLERDREMASWGQLMASYDPESVLAHARWLPVDISNSWHQSPKDLVMAGYVLGELPESHRIPLVTKLWEHTLGCLILVEPGTPEGFKRIVTARHALLERGAVVVAPCPHQAACPSDWCHFSQRVARSRVHRQAKGATMAYEDEKFSYVAVSHAPGTAIKGRVIRHPYTGKGHVNLTLCTPSGITQETVTRRDGERFRRARHLSWGDVFPHD